MSTNPKPPVLSPGASVYPSKVVRLYAGNLPSWATEVKMSSNAFFSDEQHKTTITGSGPQRMAMAEVMIGDVDSGGYPVVLHFDGGFTNTVGVTVEEPGERVITTLLTPEDDKGKLTLRVDGLTINGSTAVARSKAVLGGDTWFSLTYHRGTTFATGPVFKAKDAVPGQTYPIDVQIEFMGGGKEVVSGTVLVPADPTTPPAKGQLPTVFHHVIDTSKLGTAETVDHLVDFGDDHEQPNARYGVAHELVVASHSGGKPDLPDDVRAALRELKPFTVARANDHVTLIGGNPPLLRKNTNFRIKLLVTITPLATSPGGYGDDGEDTADWASA